MVKRRTLNKEQVVETAVRLANEAGQPDGITLKQLAAALDIKVPSLYNHVSGGAGLQREMRLFGQTRLAEMVRQATFGLSGEAALLAAAHAYRSFAQQNPGIYPLTVAAPEPDDEEGQQRSQELLQIISLLLASTGLSGDDMLHAIRGFRSVLHGFVSLETAVGFRLSLDRTDSFERLLRAYLTGLAET